MISSANSTTTHVSSVSHHRKRTQQRRVCCFRCNSRLFLSLRKSKSNDDVLSVNKIRKMEFIRGIAAAAGGGAGGHFHLCKEKNTVTKGGGLKIEPDGFGGEKFYDSQAVGIPDHLVVMVNGLVGSATDWTFAAKQFVKRLPDKVIVHRSKVNYSKLTFDGVDTMGERLADEVLNLVRDRPELHKISFIAHSLGGLIARYAIGRLFGLNSKTNSSNLIENHVSGEPAKQLSEVTIAGLEPINFITVATPHLGSRGHKQFPILFGLPFLERSASQAAHLIVGKSGKHLFLTDNDSGKPPLLLRMVKDSDDLKFMSALHAFKRRVAYANANYDHMVGWRTSSIRRQHELPRSFHLVSDERYPHIVYVERGTSEGIQNEIFSSPEDKTTDLEEEMIKGLTQVPWERVDVSFQKSRQRHVAHSTIQVKNFWFHSDGADVVFHMIDHFLL